MIDKQLLIILAVHILSYHNVEKQQACTPILCVRTYWCISAGARENLGRQPSQLGVMRSMEEKPGQWALVKPAKLNHCLASGVAVKDDIVVRCNAANRDRIFNSQPINYMQVGEMGAWATTTSFYYCTMRMPVQYSTVEYIYYHKWTYCPVGRPHAATGTNATSSHSASAKCISSRCMHDEVTTAPSDRKLKSQPMHLAAKRGLVLIPSRLYLASYRSKYTTIQKLNFQQHKDFFLHFFSNLHVVLFFLLKICFFVNCFVS